MNAKIRILRDIKVNNVIVFAKGSIIENVERDYIGVGWRKYFGTSVVFVGHDEGEEI